MAKVLTHDERNYIYNQLIFQLVTLELYDSELESIKKLKLMAKLYKDTGMEFKGELFLPYNKTITYEFYKDHGKKTNVNISKHINKPLTLSERTEGYQNLLKIIDDEKILNFNEKETYDLKNNAILYRDKGIPLKGELFLPDDKKLIYHLYNDYKHYNVIKIIENDHMLSNNERNNIYNEIVSGLKNLKVWNSKHSGIVELKRIANDYNINGTEASGEILLQDNQKIVYEFCKTHKKQTFVKITRDDNIEDDTTSDDSCDNI
jgi:hypothetical protein